MYVSLALNILLIIAYWRIFEKAGESGWKSIIPIYNTYILFKIAQGKKNDFWKYFIISIISLFLAAIAIYGLCGENGAGELTLYVVMFIVALAFSIYLIVILYRVYAGLAEDFGHERVFAWGLLFMNPIFICILAFEESEYHPNIFEESQQYMDMNTFSYENHPFNSNNEKIEDPTDTDNEK